MTSLSAKIDGSGPRRGGIFAQGARIGGFSQKLKVNARKAVAAWDDVPVDQYRIGSVRRPVRVFKALAVAGGLIAALVATSSSASVVKRTIYLEATVSETVNRSAFDFTAFTLGEIVNIAVTMPDPITSTSASDHSRFFSTTGSFTFTGDTSGATVTTVQGIEAYTRAGFTYLQSTATSGIRINPVSIQLNGPDFDGGFGTTFEDYLAYFSGGASSDTGYVGRVQTDDGVGMRFTNVQTSVIPLPAGGLLLIGGLGALALRRKIAA